MAYFWKIWLGVFPTYTKPWHWFQGIYILMAGKIVAHYFSPLHVHTYQSDCYPLHMDMDGCSDKWKNKLNSPTRPRNKEEVSDEFSWALGLHGSDEHSSNVPWIFLLTWSVIVLSNKASKRTEGTTFKWAESDGKWLDRQKCHHHSL